MFQGEQVYIIKIPFPHSQLSSVDEILSVLLQRQTIFMISLVHKSNLFQLSFKQIDTNMSLVGLTW